MKKNTDKIQSRFMPFNERKDKKEYRNSLSDSTKPMIQLRQKLLFYTYTSYIDLERPKWF